MNEFIGKWRSFITEDKTPLRENFEVGDIVTFRGMETGGDQMTVVGKRKMFAVKDNGRDLMAVLVELPDGTTSEYDETQLTAAPTITSDPNAATFDDELNALADEFSTDLMPLGEGYKIGDEVILRGGNTVTDTFTVVAKRRMFGSDLMAYSVEHPNGETMEYDETQLSAVPTIMGDRATRVDKMFADEFDNEYLDDKGNPMYDDVSGDLDADDVLDSVLDEELFTPNEMGDQAIEDESNSSAFQEGKGQDLADKYVAKLRQEFKNLSDDELDEFKKTLATAFDMNESVNEGSSMRVTKQMWQKMSDDEKENSLLTVFEDPDTAEKWIGREWDSLPGSVTRDMHTESINEGLTRADFYKQIEKEAFTAGWDSYEENANVEDAWYRFSAQQDAAQEEPKSYAAGGGSDFIDPMGLRESTKSYGDALKNIAKDKQLKMLSKKDKETLLKIADLIKGEKKESVDEVYDDKNYFASPTLANKSTLHKGLKRQIKDIEDSLESGESDGEPLTNETAMILQHELTKLKKKLKNVGGVNEGLPKGFWDKKIDAEDEDQDGKVDESYATLVNKIEKSGKSEKAAKAIAGAVASYKSKGGGKGPTAKQK